jgi:hypothetical protein
MNKEKEETLVEQVRLAEMGQQVVNNEAYKQALIARKAHLFEVFCSTSQDQSDVREEAWRTMQNLKALEVYFQQVITSGKLSEEHLELLRNGKY